MSQGKQLKGKLEGETEVLTHRETLEILSEMTRKGSVSAAISLERALRGKKDAEDIDDALDRILRDAE